ncbi:hypothetical protein Acsp03_01220 [Actinomadura sp. NBRC 104412]|uniref:hypothetical protein n=1 Tax=Actinomadura sp. NBRC 104412 TaxID=3032203 RepID=UPI0024A3C177|nr:hypothetical protein [Actinomadura sp. NBRC 104412]GLZ02655.1 hypothetical protein Acsp03_01220 [Actinomadura sp. NBRC 104412]
MDLTALALWLVTALGGFLMMGIWIARGGPRAGTTRLPVPVLFGHFALAATGLVVWIIYVVTDAKALAWTAFALLVPVALLGFAMLARWIPVYRARATAPAGAGAGGSGGGPAEQGEPPERGFPVPVVAGHGLFAVATVILVLLAALS